MFGISDRRSVCVVLFSSVLLITGCSSAAIEPALQMEASVLGHGQPVVLVGGGLLGANGWGRVPQALSRARTVYNLQSIAVEFGLADRVLPHGYSIRTEAEAMRRSLDANGLRTVDVIGMSHGGVVALVFALDNPHRVRTLTLIEPPAFWLLPNHGYDDAGARAMQDFVKSLRGRFIGEADVEHFRCLLGDCEGGRSPRDLPQWPQWVKHRNSLRALYSVGEYKDDPARLKELTMPALIVSGAQTVPFHRSMNEILLQILPNAEPLELPAGHNSPAAAPDHFVNSWQSFQDRARVSKF